MENSKPEITIEEKLQPWIDQAEYIIALTIVVMVWAGGWVDLLAFESWNSTIFGRYSVSFFSFFLVYSLGFVLWFWLIGSLSALERFRKFIGFFQQNVWAFLIVLMGMVGVIWSMIVVESWSTFPLVQAVALTMMTLFILLVLFSSSAENTSMQVWRKIAIGILSVFLLIEALLQGLFYGGMLPFDTLSGLTVPYGRIYQSEQGFVSAQTNSLGWYAPDFELQDDTYRVIISGDQYVAGIQVPLEQHFGQLLETQANNTSETVATEVMVQGQIGAGAEMYMNPLMHYAIWEPLEPDEIIVVVHLANDLANFELPDDYVPERLLGRDETPYINLSDFDIWHPIAHEVLRGHEAPLLIRTIYSNSLVLNAIGLYVFNVQDPIMPLDINNATPDTPFGDASFLFEMDSSDYADTVMDKFNAELALFNEYMAERGIDVRLVTIPYFPAEFYTLYEGVDWEMQIGDYNILQPEVTISATASENDIPYLSLGSLMQEDGLTVAEIQTLFFNNGLGYFNISGHQYLADIIYTCFYDTEQETNSSCNE